MFIIFLKVWPDIIFLKMARYFIVLQKIVFQNKKWVSPSLLSRFKPYIFTLLKRHCFHSNIFLPFLYLHKQIHRYRLRAVITELYILPEIVLAKGVAKKVSPKRCRQKHAWRIFTFADAAWLLQLRVFTTDQRRS